MSLLLLGKPASANEGDFWQYDVLGRVQIVLPADVDGDGLDELFIAANENELSLVDGTGSNIWTNSNLNGEIVALQLVSRDSDSENQLIAIGLNDALVLLESLTGRLLWRISLPSSPQKIRAIDINDDGREEIVVANRLGSLQLYSIENGERLWTYSGPGPVDPNQVDAAPEIEVGDFDRDGFPEISFAYFSEDDFGYLTLIDRFGQLVWRVGVENQVSHLLKIENDSLNQTAIAVGTIGGQLVVYEGEAGRRLWWRTPNRAITALSADYSVSPLVMTVGTDAGKVIAYDFDGQRQWETILSDSPLQPIQDIVNVPNSVDIGNRIVQYGVVVSELNPLTNTIAGEIIFLNQTGRRVLSIPASSIPNVNHIVDLNRDGFHEIALSNLGTLFLKELGLGTGGNQAYTNRWVERMAIEPSVTLQVEDGRDALIYLGTETGELYRVDTADGQPQFLQRFPFPITYLVWQQAQGEDEGLIYIGSNQPERFGGNGSLIIERGSIYAVSMEGEALWSSPVQMDQYISAIELVDLNRNGEQELVVGFDEGRLISVGQDGTIFWDTELRLDGRISQILPIENDPLRVRLLVSTETRKVYFLSNKGQDEFNAGGVLEPFHLRFSEDIVGLHQLESGLGYLLVGASGEIALFDTDLVLRDDFRQTFSRRIATSQYIDNGLLLGFADGEIVRAEVSTDGEELIQRIWGIRVSPAFQSVLWQDINNDTRPELIVGDDLGMIELYTNEGEQFAGIDLPSQVFALYESSGADSPQLITITDNGIVSSYGAQPNRPPLVIDSGVEEENGRFTFRLSVNDIDRDTVEVNLRVYDERVGEWVDHGMREADRGDGSLVWVLSLGPLFSPPIQYQYHFSDGVYSGVLEPTPFVFEVDNSLFARIGLALGAIILTLILVLLLQQTNSPNNWRSWRLYRRLTSIPEQTLNIVDVAYTRTEGSTELFANLASRARRDNRRALIRLLDGLFLLSDQTQAGLEILNNTFELHEESRIKWQNSDSWHKIVRTAYELYSAQSITELGLMRPMLLDLIKHLQAKALPAVSFEALLMPMASFRDSTRLNLVDDRLAYLHEALVLLRQEQLLLIDRPKTVSNTIASAIVSRWLGLTQALMDDLRGRPWLAISLKTKRIVAADTTQIGFEIENSGLAAAEDLRIVLHESTDYSVVNHEQTVAYLPSKRSRSIQFTITPHQIKDFRISLSVYYLDANRQSHHFDFADMVRMMASDREFQPIPNPYSPGTPLRRQSPMFFGRESLLDFIIRTAGRPEQQNIVIMVGQRRTGKTSALLRLEQKTPDHMIPVFVDCQSLGIVPGMAAFLQDLSWYISDALERKGIEMEMPEFTNWEENPVYYFQRKFLPLVMSLLPSNGRLLLIFDEFEAFEALVEDQLLPPTLFPFLRHLMQHGERLNFVFAGTHRLEQMSSEYWSILFNIALYRQIGFLDQHAAYELITRPVDPLLIYDDLALEKIWRVTAGHPYFLQLVCYTLVNHANQHEKLYITVSDVNVTLKEMLRLGEVHFAYLWQQSTFEEKALLVAASHLHDQTSPIDPVDLGASLETYDIFLSAQKVTESMRRLVERGIFHEIQEEGIRLFEFRVGLVGQWVAENKSLTELYESLQRENT